MSNTCRTCSHYDCAMDRGDVLPDHVLAYTMVDDTPVAYVPRASALAVHKALQRARDQAEEIEAKIAAAEAVALVERALTSST